MRTHLDLIDVPYSVFYLENKESRSIILSIVNALLVIFC